MLKKIFCRGRLFADSLARRLALVDMASLPSVSPSLPVADAVRATDIREELAPAGDVPACPVGEPGDLTSVKRGAAESTDNGDVGSEPKRLKTEDAEQVGLGFQSHMSMLA